MTMKQAVQGVFANMGPLPGTDERIWSDIDRKLDGRAKEIRVEFRRRKRSAVTVLLIAAALALLLFGPYLLRRLVFEPQGEIQVAAEPTAEPTPTPEPSPEPTAELLKEVRHIALVNAEIEDSGVLSLTDEGSYLARAVLPEGMTVDHWELNGEPVDAGGRRFSLEFESKGVEKVEAMLREERHVSCVNAYLQFLDENGEPAGWMYEDVCFEYDYTVPTTGELHPGGSITARVLPIDPSTEDPCYWLINGERVEKEDGHTPAGEIRLENLDRSVHIELVLQHGYNSRELGQALVLEGSGETGSASLHLEDDLPAGCREEPAPTWREVDDSRDGVPFDPDAPARDGHTHNWVLDESRTYQGTCTNPGPYTMVCSVCGREYVSMHYYGEHNYQWQNSYSSSFDGSGWHELRCTQCGDVLERSSHEWVDGGGSQNMKVCAKCGAVRYDTYSGGGGSGSGSVIPSYPGTPTPTPVPIFPVIGWDLTP